MIQQLFLVGVFILPAVFPSARTAEIIPDEGEASVVIGVHVTDLGAPLASQLGLSPEEGILVTSVLDGMPADQAGMREHDVITAVNGQPVSSRATLLKSLAGLKPGDQITLTILRGAKPLELTVGVVEDPLASDPEEAAARSALAMERGRLETYRSAQSRFAQQL
ncbi:MAG: PDZ domain-containing protein [Planctomycetota bacterium]